MRRWVRKAGRSPIPPTLRRRALSKRTRSLIQSFTNAIAKGLAWVQEHTAAEVAKVIQPSFPDTDLKTLETVVQNYKDIDAWRAEPDMKEESFQKLQTVMQEAGELEKTAPFSELVNNSFAEKTKK